MDIVNESLDNTNELLTRFGHIMTEFHAQLRGALTPLLKESRPIVRKRAIQCLGMLFCHSYLQNHTAAFWNRPLS